MEQFFKLKEYKTNVRTEVVAGLTTFFTMAYIIFVNPAILSLTGMPPSGIFVATVLSAMVGTLILSLYANVPYAQAPGMGLNAFFTFTVCFALGFKWQEALALVFICGLINMLVTVTKLRKSLILSIPSSLQNAIGGGIGLFIAFIGIKNAGLLQFVSDPGKNIVLQDGTVIADSSIIPSFVAFNNPGVLLSLVGLVVLIVLLILNVKGAIFIGILATTIIGIPFGIVNVTDVKWFDVTAIGAVKDTAFVLFSADGFGSLFQTPEKIMLALMTILAFSLTDMFDTIGTLIGTGRISGIFDENEEKSLVGGKGLNTRMDRALFADATATSVGALLGTSNVTTYVESAAGIAVGGRTGLTSLVVAVMFFLCIPFAHVVGIVPAQATAPALIIVGVYMAAAFANIKWKDISEALPALFTIMFMAFSYSITNGIAVGFITYCIVKLISGKAKEIHPMMAGATCLFILNFIIQSR